MLPVNEVVVGDCLEVMGGWPDGSVDIVVTSPPYNTLVPVEGTGKHKGSGWLKKVRDVGYEDSMDEGEYQRWLRVVVAECLRVSRGLVWVNHKVRYRDKRAIHPLRFLDFPVYAEVVWDRGGGFAFNCKRFVPSNEYIYGFGLPHYWDDRMNTKMSVWRIAPEVGTPHPCPFPVEIPSRLIEASCPVGGIVLDPFMGYGTTAVAAVTLGRKFVGIEKNQEYELMARERMSRDVGLLLPVERE